MKLENDRCTMRPRHATTPADQERPGIESGDRGTCGKVSDAR